MLAQGTALRRRRTNLVAATDAHPVLAALQALKGQTICCRGWNRFSIVRSAASRSVACCTSSNSSGNRLTAMTSRRPLLLKSCSLERRSFCVWVCSVLDMNTPAFNGPDAHESAAYRLATTANGRRRNGGLETRRLRSSRPQSIRRREWPTPGQPEFCLDHPIDRNRLEESSCRHWNGPKTAWRSLRASRRVGRCTSPRRALLPEPANWRRL